MATADHRSEWRKSSHSSNGSDRAEVALGAATAAVRDSKAPEGPALRVGAAEWERFLAGVKRRAPRLRRRGLTRNAPH
ncbi:hypothetical protein FHR84_004352 [Actinopolyspora biskrensis]|uniref:DUF397 domain-containing protein n=1 Tax=Actinopolyspora biskrensis TaxID=1470178 RepID=A0A852Z5I2_9ACTN|nr:hypothetical protein [Actinopolyspora biskrensis]